MVLEEGDDVLRAALREEPGEGGGVELLAAEEVDE